jgi:glycosyltransferase involved in cell wall biosynthesis
VITVMGGDILGDDWKPGPDIRERWLTPYALRNADLITCWSNNLIEIVRRFSGPNVPIEVVHGGVDLERFSSNGSKPQYLLDRLNLPRDARVIFSPRLMRPLYNLDKIAAAADAVCNAVPQTYFVLLFCLSLLTKRTQRKSGNFSRGAPQKIGFVLSVRSLTMRCPTIIVWLT